MDLSKYTISSSGTLLDAIHAITANQSRCIIVVNQKKVLGVISEGDLLRLLLRGTDIYSPMKKFINHSFFFLNSRDMEKALNYFSTRGISLIPIISKDMYLEDVITLKEILQKVRLVNLETPK